MPKFKEEDIAKMTFLERYENDANVIHYNGFVIVPMGDVVIDIDRGLNYLRLLKASGERLIIMDSDTKGCTTIAFGGDVMILKSHFSGKNHIDTTATADRKAVMIYGSNLTEVSINENVIIQLSKVSWTTVDNSEILDSEVRNSDVIDHSIVKMVGLADHVYMESSKLKGTRLVLGSTLIHSSVIGESTLEHSQLWQVFYLPENGVSHCNLVGDLNGHTYECSDDEFTLISGEKERVVDLARNGELTEIKLFEDMMDDGYKRKVESLLDEIENISVDFELTKKSSVDVAEGVANFESVDESKS